ncbi:MAG: response regulator transcription factor [Rhodocyclales bacterium]|nr:response regulator transcription factor [Rhodocyclales bacterium]MBI5781496.1 response regulator transcription factor [Rhodocyclales bacterium]
MKSGITHIVDDDDAIRDALAWLLRSRGLTSRSWPSAEAFLGEYLPDMRGCLVLDIRMADMSGLELFDRLLALGCTMPAIFLTGHGDVPLAVQSLKKGAFDFIEKPCNDNELVDRVIAALALDHAQRKHAASTQSIEMRLRSLTAREREVMDRVLAGQYNKVIAAELNIAMRTVEVHRAHIFEKMDVKSAVELAQLLAGGQQD